MIGLMPASVACFQKSYAPNTLPWSVMATAGIPSPFAAWMSSPTRAAPSSIEYSLCTCRWTKESAATGLLIGVLRGWFGGLQSLRATSPTGVARAGVSVAAEQVERVREVGGVLGLEGRPSPCAGVREREALRAEPLPG